jgi:hypothetical protein
MILPRSDGIRRDLRLAYLLRLRGASRKQVYSRACVRTVAPSERGPFWAARTPPQAPRYLVISLSLQRMALGGLLALVKVFVPTVASGNSKRGRVDQYSKLPPILSLAVADWEVGESRACFGSRRGAGCVETTALPRHSKASPVCS